MDFYEWLESNAVLERPRTSNGGTGFPPPVDDDGGGDDGDDGPDEHDDWDFLEKRYGAAVKAWAASSPFAKQINNLLAEATMAGNPKVSWQSGGRTTRDYGKIQMDLKWEMPYNEWTELDDQTEAILRKSDIHKAFRIDPRQMWNFLDKGDVVNWVMMKIIQVMTSRYAEPKPGQYYTGKHSDFDKQIGFHAFTYVSKNRPKYEKWLRQRITGDPNATLVFNLSKPVAAGGQYYDGSLTGGATFYWDYYEHTKQGWR